MIYIWLSLTLCPLFLLGYTEGSIGLCLRLRIQPRRIYSLAREYIRPLQQFCLNFTLNSRPNPEHQDPVVITLNSHASSGPSQINQEIRLLLWRNWSYIFKFYRLRAKYEMYTHLSINCFIGVNQHLESQWYCIVCTVQRVGLHPWSSDFGRQSLQMFA